MAFLEMELDPEDEDDDWTDLQVSTLVIVGDLIGDAIAELRSDVAANVWAISGPATNRYALRTASEKAP